MEQIKTARGDVRVTVADMEACFKGVEHQADVMAGLYRLVYPDWDQIEKVKGFPRMSANLSEYVWERFMVFDRKHHPKVMHGGLWMNNGFSTDDGLPENTVAPAPVTMK